MTDERAIEDRIRARAHEIWQREGCPEGEELRHWDEARLEIEVEERVASTLSPETRNETMLDGDVDTTADSVLESPVGETRGSPDLFPEAGRESPNEDLPLERPGLERSAM